MYLCVPDHIKYMHNMNLIDLIDWIFSLFVVLVINLGLKNVLCKYVYLFQSLIKFYFNIFIFVLRENLCKLDTEFVEKYWTIFQFPLFGLKDLRFL